MSSFPQPFPALTDHLETAGVNAALRAHADHRGRIAVTRAPTGTAASFSIRRQDASNKWQFVFNTNGSVLLREHVTGTPTTRDSAPIGTLNDGEVFTWSAIGSTIIAYLDGSEILTYASATNFATVINGLWEAVGDGDFDEITITPP